MTPWRLQRYAHLPSTQALAVTLAEAGEPEGLVLLADRQTAGIGTQGRAWTGAAGNLHLSVLLRPTAPLAEVAQYALLAGVALAEAMAEHLPAPPRLKWPNDVLIDGAKAAGILAQAAGGPRLDWLVLGLGVNIAHAPDIRGRATACMGLDLDPETLARALLDRLDHWRRLRLTEGFAPIRAAWLAFGPDLGTHLALARPAIAGRFEGLSETGALLLGTAGRVHAVQAGEIQD